MTSPATKDTILEGTNESRQPTRPSQSEYQTGNPTSWVNILKEKGEMWISLGGTRTDEAAAENSSDVSVSAPDRAFDFDSPEFSGDEESTDVEHRDQVPLKAQETFRQHPTDPTKMIATVRFPRPNDVGWYTQVDEIPKIITSALPSNEDQFYFKPALTDVKCPGRALQPNSKDVALWVEDKPNNVWKRSTSKGEEIFRPILLFRRFDLRTHEYVSFYVSNKSLEHIDPNSRAWWNVYNTWINAIRRRRDDTFVLGRSYNRWTMPETRALYTGINKFCQQRGVHRFGVGNGAHMRNVDYRVLIDAVNAAGNNNRIFPAVRNQIQNARNDREGPLGDLLRRAKAMREQIAAGNDPPLSERFPAEAIPLSEFPGAQFDSAAEDGDDENELEAEASSSKG